MVGGTTRARTGFSPIFMLTNALIWISAVIVMGILSYLISLNGQAGSHIIYMEVISVLTVVFFLFAFFPPSSASLNPRFNAGCGSHCGRGED